jgi:hypothetical protein
MLILQVRKAQKSTAKYIAAKRVTKKAFAILKAYSNWKTRSKLSSARAEHKYENNTKQKTLAILRNYAFRSQNRKEV